MLYSNCILRFLDSTPNRFRSIMNQYLILKSNIISKGENMSINMKCNKCGKEISQFKLRFFSLLTLTICTHCWRINKLSFASNKDKNNWIVLNILVIFGILFYPFIQKIYPNNQLEGIYYIISLLIAFSSNHFLYLIVAKGKVHINEDHVNKN